MAYQPKSYRKFLATTVTASLVATAVAPAALAASNFTDVSANYEAAVSYLVENNITSGLTETTFGTTANITRGDAAVLVANALGLDLTQFEAAPFTDVNARQAGAVSALYALNIINGKTETTFKPGDNITRAEMAKVIANAFELVGAGEALPFTDVNSTFAAYVDALYTNGITSGKTETSFGSTQAITRGEFAIFLFRALEGGEVVTGDVAVETVTASTVQTLAVEFTAPVTEELTFAVKKGSISHNFSKVEWNEEKTVATITMNSKLTKGDYTVTVDGLEEGLTNSGTATVVNQYVANIEFTSQNLVLGYTVNNGTVTADTSKVTVGYTLKDQYGSDVTTDLDGSVNFNTSKGAVDSSTDGTIVLDSATFAIDDKVVITGLNQSNGVFANGTFTVSPMPHVKGIAFGEVTLEANNDAQEVFTNNLDKFFIPLTINDQYGNPIKDASLVNASILPLLSNVAATVATDAKGNLIVELDDLGANQLAGKASVTYVSKNTGDRNSIEFDVLSVASVKDLTIDFPSLIVAGDSAKVELGYTALDQYGKAVTNVTALNNAISSLGVSGSTGLSNTDFEFVYDYKTKTTKLQLDVSGANVNGGKGYLTLVTPGNEVYQTSFDVAKKATPVVVSSTKDLVTNIVDGSANGVIKTTNVVLKDSYDRNLAIADLGAAYQVKLSVGATSKVKFANNATEAVLNGNTALVVSGTGAATITATLEYNDGNGFAPVEGSSMKLNYNVVKASDVKSYELAEVGTLFAENKNPADAGYTNNTDYDTTLAITGALADGSKVVLNNNVIKNVKSSNENIVTADLNTLVVTAVDTTTRSNTDLTASIIVTLEGPSGAVVLTSPVTISHKTPVATTVATTTAVVDGIAYIDVDDLKAGALAELTGLVTVKDQYGVAYPGALTTIITNSSRAAITSVATIAANVAAGDTFVVTVMADNGKAVSYNVVVTN